MYVYCNLTKANKRLSRGTSNVQMVTGGVVFRNNSKKPQKFNFELKIIRVKFQGSSIDSLGGVLNSKFKINFREKKRPLKLRW